MNKINVTICAGNDCNQTQASWLKQFDQILSPKLKSRVQLACGRCERACTSDRANAPRVKVNGRVYSQATPAQVRAAILAEQPAALAPA